MFKKIILIVVISIVVLLVAVMIFLPGIARRYIVAHSEEIVGRQIALQELHINYFHRTARLIHFVLYEKNKKDIFMTFDTLEVKLKPLPLLRNELIVQKLYLSGLNTTVVRHDSSFNFNDLVPYLNSLLIRRSKSDSTRLIPLKYQISNIEFKNAQVEYQDQNIEDTLLMRNLSFFIPYIGRDQQTMGEAGLRFAFKREGYFELALDVDPKEGDFLAQITIYALYLDAFTEYAESYANIGSLEGKFNSQFNISGNVDRIKEAVVSGNVLVENMMIRDLQEKVILQIDETRLKFSNLDYDQADYKIDSLVLNAPYIYFEKDTASNNLARIFNLLPNNQHDQTGQPEQTFALPASFSLEHFRIEKGSVDLLDKFSNGNFKYHLSDIKMNADDLKSTSEQVKLNVTMLLNEKGQLEAKVRFNPKSPRDVELDYVISDFMLSDLNIYSKHYVGFPVLYGEMYYKSHMVIQNNQLKADNNLILNNVELGKKTEGQYNVPLKFALYLLKDNHSIVRLDVPMQGDLNDPGITVNKIVWRTFKNLIVKVATAPVDYLARSISVDPSDIKEIQYDYTDTSLTEAKKRKLDHLLKLEQKKDDLQIQLVYFDDVEFEKSVIRLQEAGKLFADETGKNPRKNEEEFMAFLHKKTGTDTLDIKEMAKLVISDAVTDSIAKAMFTYRQQSIRDYLFRQNKATEIEISVASDESPKNVMSYPEFEVKYSLKENEHEE